MDEVRGVRPQRRSLNTTDVAVCIADDTVRELSVTEGGSAAGPSGSGPMLADTVCQALAREPGQVR
jgi:hypothetical protein